MTRGRGRRRPFEGGRRDQDGYLMIMLAVSLTTLLVCTSLALDVGGWYSRATQLQRGADAAALAGVVWMPDLPTSETAALAAAARNGFVRGGNITITVTVSAGSTRRLTVAITDSKAPRHFSRGTAGNQALVRRATAEYILPVPLGSPKNTFGTGDLLTSTNRENFWAAVNGYCGGHESGDLKLTRYESYSTSTGASLQCNNGSAQTADYDPTGYQYAIELPQAAAALKLEVYDASYNTAGSTPDVALATETQTVTTVFEVFSADNTPLDTSDNPLVATSTVTTNSLLHKNLWVNLHTWVLASAGTYYIRVKTLAQATESRASNGFAFRAYTGAVFATCTSIVGASGYSAACPQIHGVGAMSIYANLGGAAGSTATFYLAEVASLHAGKTMQLTLFDSGEGAQSIEVLDPNGNPATFSWRTPCSPPTPPSGSCSGSTVTSLNVSGAGTPPYTGLQGTSKYNDRRMILDIKLPANYTTVFGTKTWWRIRYTVGSTSTDRTTWSVGILGDPVHLVGG